MLFAIGTKVKFLHTADDGVVAALLEGGMVSVYLPKYDMEIPAFPDDLVRAEVVLRHPVKAKVVEGKKAAPAPAPPPVSVETQYTILKSYGIQLAFEAVETREDVPEKYAVFLLNDTRYDVVYTVRLLLNYRGPQVWSDSLRAVNFTRLGEILYDDLNEAPEFEIECRWVTTEGLSEPVLKSLKIKPKTFFGTLKTAPFLNKPVHLYRLFEKPEQPTQKEGEDLESYTKRHAKPIRSTSSKNQFYDIHNTTELANFDPEIDLHIEKLTESWRKMPNSDILKTQLLHFENFISKAIRLGVPRVFVIHGVGEGKLRDAIATRLMQNPDVQTFKNEYHHRYGWGATEVVF